MTLPPWYVPDPEGTDLRPDPDAVTTAAELLTAMRLYRIWSGNPTFRVLAARCRNRVSAPAFGSALAGDRLPPLKVVQNFTAACGATPEYYARFESAWQRAAVPGPGAGRPVLLVRPVGLTELSLLSCRAARNVPRTRR